MKVNIVKLFLLINILLPSISAYIVPINLFFNPKTLQRLSTCFKNEDMCSKDSECCSNICKPLNISKMSFCVQSLQYPITTVQPTILIDENCKANNVVCVDDDQCCNKKCVPVGFNKYSQCVD